jgi:hypothetical protein
MCGGSSRIIEYIAQLRVKLMVRGVLSQFAVSGIRVSARMANASMGKNVHV